MSALAGHLEGDASEVRSGVGTVPLTPIMRTLAERAGETALTGRFHQSMIVSVPPALTYDRLAGARGEDADLAARTQRLTAAADRCEAVVAAEADAGRARERAEGARGAVTGARREHYRPAQASRGEKGKIGSRFPGLTVEREPDCTAA